MSNGFEEISNDFTPPPNLVSGKKGWKYVVGVRSLTLIRSFG